MALIVQKYGGSPVADAELIKRVAKCVVETEKKGNKVAVMVSVMGGTTDDLIDQVLSIDSNPPERKMNVLMIADERTSMSLLAMAIHAEGSRAHSFAGQQAGSFTDAHYGTIHIKAVGPDRVENALSLGDIAIVAGFQGTNARGDATTLGRGGSDTFAVAPAVALGADICEIYTDVDGIFTVDPYTMPSARRIPLIDYESIPEMASCSSKVLALRCVEYTQRFNMPLYVRSSLSRRSGTSVVPDGTDPRTLPNLD